MYQFTLSNGMKLSTTAPNIGLAVANSRRAGWNVAVKHPKRPSKS